MLEHRSFGYNWLQQTKAQNDRDKKDSFMSYIRQLSKDKITFFIQGGSKGKNRKGNDCLDFMISKSKGLK